MAKNAPDYGLDAPGVVRGFLLGGPVLAVGGWFLNKWASPSGWSPALGLAGAMMGTGSVFFIEALLMAGSSYYGKFRARDRLLERLRLRGDEKVLDVGCGHGLLLVGAAKRLPNGRAVGIDLWSQRDQGDNHREATLANAALEGVAERVEVRDGDMRKMPFPDASFDAVVANLAIHNIPSREGRREAIGEIVRVLRPGGQVALMDFKKVGQYADDLKATGMTDVRIFGPTFWIFPPVRTAAGKKPLRSA